MRELKLNNLKKHWRISAINFSYKHQDCISLFFDILSLVVKVSQLFEGKKSLRENGSYLLLAKAVNHCLSTYTLFERGLVIDGGLAARNAIETLLMLELFIKDTSGKYFKDWFNGKQYKPSYIRKKLSEYSKVTVGEVIVKTDSDFYEDFKYVYNWLSSITHSNIESLSYIIKKGDKNLFGVYVGGNIEGQDFVINIIFAIICRSLFNAVLICTAILNLPFLEGHKQDFNFFERINEVVKKAKEKRK